MSGVALASLLGLSKRQGEGTSTERARHEEVLDVIRTIIRYQESHGRESSGGLEGTRAQVDRDRALCRRPARAYAAASWRTKPAGRPCAPSAVI